VHGTRPHEHPGASREAAGARRRDEPVDDWLGELSDEDWNEGVTARSGPREAGHSGNGMPVDELWLEPERTAAEAPRARGRSDARRAAIERRRYTAGFVLLVALALAIGIPVLLLRGGGTSDVTPAEDAAATTPTATGSTTSPTTTTTTTTTPAAGPSDTAGSSTTTPSTTPSTTTTEPSASTETTPSSSGGSAFTLPEGTKLQLGEGDPALVRELQQALTRAGYDPGPADGTFGRRTESSVAAFQEAHGLSVDGRVGPETAAALNEALAGG
jgi:hypothetical protein